jgi:hypothetical protein
MNVEFIAKAVVAVAAIGTFGFGLLQYTKAQRWKRAEFAAKEIDKLSTDPLLSLACTLLDWNSRTLAVPESYKYKVEKDSFVHSWAILEKAMVPKRLYPDDSFDWQEVLYRDIFDHFFIYLVRINHYVDINLISVDDISILKYWLQQIDRPEMADKKPIFHGYIRKFGFAGVNNLSRKLGVSYYSEHLTD